MKQSNSLEHESSSDPETEAPILIGRHTYASITDKLSDLVLRRPVTFTWILFFGFFAFLTAFLIAAVVVLVTVGVGIWGIQIPTAWGIAIINYVWWIEIAMGGTFISAALYSAHQPWRTTINRFAECMMLAAWVIAAAYPLMHLGRPWFWYWLMPYPDTMNLYPQFHSALIWDVIAILAYGGVSILFFYSGLLPDLASLRDRAEKHWKKVFFGILALGWRGSARQWACHRKAYLLMAGLAAPIVFTVHSVVALDFTIALIPGWHDPFMPPYFIAGAILQGLATAVLLGVPLRYVFKLHRLITPKHFDNLGKLQLVMVQILFYTYFMEAFMAYFSDTHSEISQMNFRLFGTYAPLFWTSIFCICIVTQLLWSKRVRRNVVAMFFISLFIQCGVWVERYWLVVDSTAHSLLPGMRRTYHGTFWDYSMLSASIGFFLLLFFLLLRIVPPVATAETRELVYAEELLADEGEQWKPEGAA